MSSTEKYRGIFKRVDEKGKQRLFCVDRLRPLEYKQKPEEQAKSNQEAKPIRYLEQQSQKEENQS